MLKVVYDILRGNSGYEADKFQVKHTHIHMHVATYTYPYACIHWKLSLSCNVKHTKIQ